MVRSESQSRAIIIQNEKILLMHRRRQGSEFFVLPGGWIDPAETPEEAVAREVYEETGLKATAVDSGFDIVDYNGVLVHIFYVMTEDGEPVLVGEEKDFSCEENWYNPEWFDLSIINQPNFYPISVRNKLLEDKKD